jgi:LacI family transcriptional regulator
MGTRNDFIISDLARALNLSTSVIRRALDSSGIKNRQRNTGIAQPDDTLHAGRNTLNGIGGSRPKSYVFGSLVTHLNSTIPSCVLSGAEFAAAEMGYCLMIHQSMNNPELRSNNLESLINHNVDGVLVTSAYFQESESLDQLTALNIPVVMVETSSLLPSRPRKKVSDLQNAVELTEYLIEKGCRQIAYVSEDLNSPRHINLLSGCREALKKSKLPGPETLVSKYDNGQNNSSVISHLLLSASSSPDGILFSNDVVTALAFTPHEPLATQSKFFITWRKGSMSSQNKILVEIGKLAASLLVYLSERKKESPLQQRSKN